MIQARTVVDPERKELAVGGRVHSHRVARPHINANESAEVSARGIGVGMSSAGRRTHGRDPPIGFHKGCGRFRHAHAGEESLASVQGGSEANPVSEVIGIVAAVVPHDTEHAVLINGNGRHEVVRALVQCTRVVIVDDNGLGPGFSLVRRAD